MTRFFDIFFSLFGLILLSPLLLILMLIIILNSRGGPFFLQTRVGRNNRDFRLIKFRTMKMNAENDGQLTVGSRDPRITGAGVFLRKNKLDELPQLINVLKGDMSLVGPRPEVRKYVDLYNESQMKVLKVRPGITDHASLEYFNENELLVVSQNPEETYIREIMPAKIILNMKYIDDLGLRNYFSIIFRTIVAVTRSKN
ncbi:MAG: sugar transferase [Syntrophothermus sp.]